MFKKTYKIKKEHIDFQGIVDGLYYPFYMEWARHSFMKECTGLNLEDEFKQGRVHIILEYTMKFRRSLHKDDNIEVTCILNKSNKRNRVNFAQQILVDGNVYAEGLFVATCLVNGRPTIPQEVLSWVVESGE